MKPRGLRDAGLRRHATGPCTVVRPGDTATLPERIRFLPCFREAQANNSLITLPALAIFIGRPFLAVNVVSSEMSSDFSTLAMRSCEE